MRGSAKNRACLARHPSENIKASLRQKLEILSIELALACTVYFRVYAQVIKRDTEILMTTRRDNNILFIEIVK